MTAPLTPTEIRDPRQLAARLAELQLPGRRSMTAITRLRRDRQHHQIPPARPKTLRERADERIVARYRAEIHRRGGETVIEEGHKASALKAKPLAIADRRDGFYLLHVTGWRFYSRGFGSRPATLSYLCGTDDSGTWAVRVPGTVTTVPDALDWITPAEVKKALAAGRRVRRQGDIYAIETTARYDTPSGWIGDDTRWQGGELVTSHYWNAETRTLVHRPEDGRKHRPLRIPFHVKFVQQRPYAMDRTGQRTNGD